MGTNQNLPEDYNNALLIILTTRGVCRSQNMCILFVRELPATSQPFPSHLVNPDGELAS